MNNLRVYVSTNVIRAREYIYKSGITVDGLKVEELLGAEGSWVPVLVSVNCLSFSLTGSDKRLAERFC
jgi:hypothetical protein